MNGTMKVDMVATRGGGAGYRGRCGDGEGATRAYEMQSTVW